jgi:hypothetical protein
LRLLDGALSYPGACPYLHALVQTAPVVRRPSRLRLLCSSVGYGGSSEALAGACRRRRIRASLARPAPSERVASRGVQRARGAGNAAPEGATTGAEAPSKTGARVLPRPRAGRAALGRRVICARRALPAGTDMHPPARRGLRSAGRLG